MLTLPVEEWVGNAAAVVSGVWGAVTRRSEQSGYSRTAIYTHAQRVVQAVANEQATGISYEALWAENERLRAETETLWQQFPEACKNQHSSGIPPCLFVNRHAKMWLP